MPAAETFSLIGPAIAIKRVCMVAAIMSVIPVAGNARNKMQPAHLAQAHFAKYYYWPGVLCVCGALTKISNTAAVNAMKPGRHTGIANTGMRATLKYIRSLGVLSLNEFINGGTIAGSGGGRPWGDGIACMKNVCGIYQAEERRSYVSSAIPKLISIETLYSESSIKISTSMAGWPWRAGEGSAAGV